MGALNGPGNHNYHAAPVCPPAPKKAQRTRVISHEALQQLAASWQATHAQLNMQSAMQNLPNQVQQLDINAE